MSTTKFEVGQSVLVKAEIDYICIDKDHGITYGLIIRDYLFVEDGQSNKQHVAGIAEKDILKEESHLVDGNEAKVLGAESGEEEPGQWQTEDGSKTKAEYSVYCSKCGSWSEYRTKYCGNCGSLMKEENDEQ